MTEKTKSSKKYVTVENIPSLVEDEIDLFKLIHTLLKGWKTIVAITVVCIGLAYTYAIHAPKVYIAETVVTGAKEDRNDPPFLLGEIEGLAAMAGISIPYNSNIDIIVKTIESKNFIGKYITKYGVDFSYYETPDQEKVNKIKILKDSLSIMFDKKSEIIEISLEWHSKETVHDILNNLIVFVNEHFRQKAILNSTKRLNYLSSEITKTTLQDMRAVLFKLMASEKQKAMLANVNEDFALEVIDPAVPSRYHEKPKRNLIILLGFICGGVLGIFVVLFVNFLKKLTSSLTS